MVEMSRAGRCLVMAALVPACTPSPEEQIRLEVEAETAKINRALERPSGDVDATSVGAIFDAMRRQHAASRAAACVPGIGAPTPATQDVDDRPCVEAFDQGGVLDLHCATNGEVRGSVTYSAAVEGSLTYFVFDYVDVCAVAEGVCLDGRGAQVREARGAAGSTTLMGGSFEVERDGASQPLGYGYEMRREEAGTTVRYAVFAGGESFVVSDPIDGMLVRNTIVGHNGRFVCTAATEDRWRGSCSGSASFEF